MDEDPVWCVSAVTRTEAALVLHRMAANRRQSERFDGLLAADWDAFHAVPIDAANEHELLLDLCQQLGVRSVIETHGHHDHIQAVPAVRDAGFRVAVTAEDAGMLPSYDDILEDESVFAVGRLRLHTILT